MVEAEFAELSPIWWEAVENVDPRLIVSIGSLGQLKKTDRFAIKSANSWLIIPWSRINSHS